MRLMGNQGSKLSSDGQYNSLDAHVIVLVLSAPTNVLVTVSGLLKREGKSLCYVLLLGKVCHVKYL